MIKNKLFSLFIRYFIILFAGLFNLFLFYEIFTPITINLVNFVLNLFSSTELISNIIIFNGLSIELVSACIAGAAYYLMFILIMSVPNIKISKRIALILFSFSIFLILNVARIIFFSFITNFAYFDLVHMSFWYLFSTIFIVGIWLIDIKIFKIKSIPVYSDLKFMFKLIKK